MTVFSQILQLTVYFINFELCNALMVFYIMATLGNVQYDAIHYMKSHHALQKAKCQIESIKLIKILQSLAMLFSGYSCLVPL